VLLLFNILFSVIGWILLAIGVWYSSQRVDNGQEVSGYLGLIACGWIAINWLGRFLTMRVMAWAQHPATLPSHNRSAATIVGIYSQLEAAAGHVMQPVMSLRLSRDLMSAASAAGGGFDAIAHVLVDRALGAGEVAWAHYFHERHSFDELEFEPDSDEETNFDEA
ncbi:MAG TPA: hypothetical protein VNS57_11225, partial [Steroidobacteraceae bacterium]|nr:hypothetical protein [Steroidobacteraceae bacterium]